MKVYGEKRSERTSYDSTMDGAIEPSKVYDQEARVANAKVTKATKVYSALKAEQSVRGYTLSELVEKLSELYAIPPSQTFRREVALALRRGVDYGILVKSKDKYRFDPEKSLSNSVRFAARRRGRVARTFARVTKSTARVTRKQMGNRVPSGEDPKTEPPKVPRPTVPPPPNFTPKPRNLTTEPFNKVIKHRSEKRQSCERM